MAMGITVGRDSFNSLEDYEMNAADLTRSERLQRVESLLSDGKEYSTLEIVYAAKVCAVSAAIAEIRQNGRDIACRREGNVWFYRMEGL